MAEEELEITDGMLKFELKPSIKLTRGQRGNYGWEIRIISTNVEELNLINNEMVKRFGNGS